MLFRSKYKQFIINKKILNTKVAAKGPESRGNTLVSLNHHLATAITIKLVSYRLLFANCIANIACSIH